MKEHDVLHVITAAEAQVVIYYTAAGAEPRAVWHGPVESIAKAVARFQKHRTAKNDLRLNIIPLSADEGEPT